MQVFGVRILNEALVSSKQKKNLKMLKYHIKSTKIKAVISKALFVNNAYCVEIYHMLLLSQTIDYYL